MSKMKFITDAGKVDLSKWGFSALSIIDKLHGEFPSAAEGFVESLEQEFTSSLECALKDLVSDSLIYFYFTSEDGVDHPLNLRLELPFDSGGELPTWQFSLQYALEDSEFTRRLDPDYKKKMAALSEGLRALANDVDREAAEETRGKTRGKPDTKDG